MKQWLTCATTTPQNADTSRSCPDTATLMPPAVSTNPTASTIISMLMLNPPKKPGATEGQSGSKNPRRTGLSGICHVAELHAANGANKKRRRDNLQR
jgi:hypothetical protein